MIIYVQAGCFLEFSFGGQLKGGVFIAMKGNIDNELTNSVEKEISKKYQIVKITKFLLPIEESNRSLVVIRNM